MKHTNANLNLLTVAQATRILGLHEVTVRRWISERYLPVIDLNKGRCNRAKLRIKESDLVQFIEKIQRIKE